MSTRPWLKTSCALAGLWLASVGVRAEVPGYSAQKNAAPRANEKKESARPVAQLIIDNWSKTHPGYAPEVNHPKPLWPAVVVGSTESDDGSIGAGQIALRGPLVVVASRGAPNKNDALDGVHILDGREALREVRRIPSPMREKADEGESDAIGVALDGDFVVFGTYGGFVTKVRLDGVPAWSVSDFPSDARPGLPALIDVNADGVRDAIVPVVVSKSCAASESCVASWRTLALVLDGTNGALVRKLEYAPSSPHADCSERFVSWDASAARIGVGCVDSENAPWRWYPLADATLSPSSAGPPLATRQVSVNGLTDSPAWNTLSIAPDARSLLVSAGGANGVSWRELDAPLQSPPSIGDINLDGAWDIVVVAGGTLQAFATSARSDAELPLWRGDLAATGALPAIDSPAAYASRIEPRDLARWLKRDLAPKDRAFELVAREDVDWNDAAFAREPVVLPREPKQAQVSAETLCGEHYALNEGNLIVQHSARWERVPGAPAPIVGLACRAGALVMRTPSARDYRLPAPKPWPLDFAFGLALVAFAAAFAGWYTARPAGLPRYATQPVDTRQEARAARRVVISDAPRTKRSEAHPSQERLLSGLMNVLDNDDTRPPVTLALYGAWGSGKSSIMQMLRSELNATGRYIDVWFNAWRFQREQEIAPALLQCIVDEVGKKTDWVTRVAVVWHRVRRATMRDIGLFLLPPAALALLLAACVRYATSTAKVGVGGKLGAIASVAVLFFGGAHKLITPLLKVFSLDPAKLLASDDSKRRIQFVSEFAHEFEQISTRLPRGTRLVVFVDDLDRCAPERIVDLLETLSMLADTGCGFFVLALDPITVRRAIELKYKELLRLARKEDPDEVGAFGRRYLEKMITLAIKVPVLAADEVEPDERLDLVPARPNFLEWIRQHVLPEPPLLVALACVGIFSFLASRNLELVNGMLDAMARLAIDIGPQTGAIQTDASALSAAPTPTPTTTAAGTSDAAAHPATSPPREAVKPLANAGEKAKPQKPRASVLPRVPAPPLVEAEAREAPSAAIELSEVLVAVALGLCALLLICIAALVALDWRRRQRIRAARPMGSDSAAFASALRACKKGLEANPRGVVRFTNTARFLYQVVAQETDAPAEEWEPAFFAALHARWSGEAAAATEPWLELALDRWLPDEGTRTPERARPALTSR